MTGKKLLVIVAAVAAAIGFGAPAGAAPKAPPTTARVIGPVVIDRSDPSVGYLTALYRCYGEGTLWVSVKQTAARDRDPGLMEEESSSISAAWSMSHRNSVDCDGRLHVQRFTLDQVETDSFHFPNSDLQRGWGWVQFCLFDDNYPIPPENPETGMPFYDYGFHRVL